MPYTSTVKTLLEPLLPLLSGYICYSSNCAVMTRLRGIHVAIEGEDSGPTSSVQVSRSHSSMGSLTAGAPNMTAHMYSKTRPLR